MSYFDNNKPLAMNEQEFKMLEAYDYMKKPNAVDGLYKVWAVSYILSGFVCCAMSSFVLPWGFNWLAKIFLGIGVAGCGLYAGLKIYERKVFKEFGISKKELRQAKKSGLIDEIINKYIVMNAPFKSRNQLMKEFGSKYIKNKIQENDAFQRWARECSNNAEEQKRQQILNETVFENDNNKNTLYLKKVTKPQKQNSNAEEDNKELKL